MPSSPLARIATQFFILLAQNESRADKVELAEEILDGFAARRAWHRDALRLVSPDGERGLDPLDGIVGVGAAIQQVRLGIQRAASTEQPVLILGETGTGKTLIAGVIHALGPRAAEPFVPVSVAAFAEDLIESELFGHEKGAFTGAIRSHRGVFERAHGGTLFLDEIGDLARPLQVKLLKALEEGHVLPVGAEKAVPAKVRFIAGTHHDLAHEAQQNRFRGDLFYRLDGLRMLLPALRDRREDIVPLVIHFLGGAEGVPMEPAAIRYLQQLPWPGNLRQLKQKIELLGDLHPGGISLEDILTDCPELVPPADEPDPEDLSNAEDAFRRSHIRKHLAASHGCRSETARRLGRSEEWLRQEVKRLGIPPEFGRPEA
ncbi:MAG: sigma-54-dependent Fis family transcriptional regulator [Planctomycetes bacterium]|nr:sigma-54-dependent Fis family transcriptional regulator [Planctomycetota bacterium]